MRQLKYAVIILALTTGAGAYGQSAKAPTSRLNAYSCEALPDPLQVDVQLLDDSERNVALGKLFTKALQDRGVVVSKTAPTTAILEVRTVREFQGSPKASVFEKGSDRELTRKEQEGAVSMHGNIWSNREGSLLGGPKDPPTKFSLNRLGISVTLNRRADGRCLWQGEVLHDLQSTEDPDLLARKLVPFLARAVGKSVRNRSLTVYP
jgi:hypothetical protein